MPSIVKAAPVASEVPFDTIASINEPSTVNAVTTSGLNVIVPAATQIGDYVQLNTDETAPTGVANVVKAADFVTEYVHA